MYEVIASVVDGFGHTILKILPITLALAVAFTFLSWLSRLNPGRPWWRKREIVTDLCYWFIIPLMTRFLRIGLLVVGAALVFGITDAKDVVAFYEYGHGSLAKMPLWAQAAIFLVASDFMLYWTHRLFHGARLWRYHAVHHSSEDLEWISAGRFHPINLFLGTVLVDVVLLMAGIAPDVLVLVGPFTTAHSALVHANLNWTFGPFKYVLASPVFHRWHHTALDVGGSKNFAGTFPIFDVLFGTFYMPERQLPETYGNGDPDFPQGFGAQMLYPFKRP